MLIDDVEGTARQEQARELELELIRVRSQAEAARLEARAAELELLLRRLARGGDIDSAQSVFAANVTHDQQPIVQSIHSHQVNEATSDGWSTRLARLNARSQVHSPSDSDDFAPALNASPSALTAESAASPAPLWTPRIPLEVASPQPTDIEATGNRIDSSSHTVQPAHFIEPSIETIKPADTSPDIALPTRERVPHKIDVKAEPIKPPDAFEIPAPKVIKPKPIAILTPLPALKKVDHAEVEKSKWQFRPAAWLVSTVAHVAVIILLGLLTLASSPPKDQVSFNASASESSTQSMETFSVESSEPLDQSEPSSSDTAYEVSAVGTMAITKVSMDAPPAMAPPSSSEMFSESKSSLSSSAMKSLKSDTNSKMQFCGVDGGGSHFFYIVDASASMRSSFDAARNELLGSIDLLQPDQRFYVTFFGLEPSYMRIANPNEDEPASVMATPENKIKLRRWAMTIKVPDGPGKGPYAILPFALELRPDVIFLLSDGGFSEKLVTFFAEKNQETNLFGETGPISILHTIRYYSGNDAESLKAEEIMKRVSKANGGQYRHVPRPK